MHFLPILSSLRRHRAAATLIVLEMAVTCAVVCNAVFLIRDRLSRMATPSGLVEDELVRVRLASIGKDDEAGAVTAQDLTALRAIPGVRLAAVTNMVPLGRRSWTRSISTIPDDPSPEIQAALYLGSPGLLETMGARLIAGRDFILEEYVDFDAPASDGQVSTIIITRGLADRMFPGANPIGQRVYASGPEPQTVVGVVEQLAGPTDAGGAGSAADVIILPVALSYQAGGNYLLRVESSRRAEVLAAVDGALSKVNPHRIILERQTFGDIRDAYFKQDRAMAYLLTGMSLALLIITALGIVGLASFWVQQRTRQIGIRRALGATRGDIVRHFQLENFILASAGIILGMALAYAINLWLMRSYHQERLPAGFLPIGALLLWSLGQIAVLGPAIRASSIPPAIATRTV